MTAAASVRSGSTSPPARRQVATRSTSSRRWAPLDSMTSANSRTISGARTGAARASTEPELPQEEDIALARSGEPVEGGPVDRATENGHEQPADVLRAETGNVKPLDVIVPPERYHGVRRTFASPDGR